MFGTVLLGALLASSALADDFLARVSQGTLSDKSEGVKVLSLDEMKEVKGGIFRGLYLLSFSTTSYLNAPRPGGPTYSGLVLPSGLPNNYWW